MGLTNKLLRGDYMIWIIFILLMAISLISVFSATSTLAYKNTYFWEPVTRHAKFLGGGFLLVLFIQYIPSRMHIFLALFLPIAIILLFATLIIGETENDASRWINLMGFRFQPSEIAKVSCIAFVAFIMSRAKKMGYNKAFIWSVLATSLTCLLIFSENLSTAILLFFVCFLIMFIGCMPMKKLAQLLLAGILLGVMLLAALFLLPDSTLNKVTRAKTWKNRLIDFTEVKKDGDQLDTYVITDDNYQYSHAKIAVAQGGVFGKMAGNSTQRDFLPQAYSDFIYAIIIEEWGLVGGLVVLFLYVFLLLRVGVIAKRSDKLFPRFLVLGCGLLIVTQALFHMAIATSFFPVTGQPLPLISRGGTSTIINCIYFGIILSISRFNSGMDGKFKDDEVLVTVPIETEDATLIEEIETEANPLEAIEATSEEVLIEKPEE